jgi:uncharacterized protein YjbJ (UPF0337 family)
MNWNIIEGKWKEMAGSAKERWGKLTDDELTQIAGRRDKLEGALQTRYGLSQDAAARQVDEWADSVKHAIGK